VFALGDYFLPHSVIPVGKEKLVALGNDFQDYFGLGGVERRNSGDQRAFMAEFSGNDWCICAGGAEGAGRAQPPGRTDRLPAAQLPTANKYITYL
jgi:hypothetical protein